MQAKISTNCLLGDWTALSLTDSTLAAKRYDFCKSSGSGAALEVADTITVSGVETRCVLGVNPEERWRLQLVRLSLELELDGRSAAYSANLAQTVDYSQLTRVSRFVLMAGRFFLVETAVEALCAVIVAQARGTPLAAVTVELAKPEALPGAACVRYRARRSVEHYALPDEQTSYGSKRQIFSMASIMIAGLKIKPAAGVPQDLLSQPGASWLALSSGLEASSFGPACLNEPDPRSTVVNRSVHDSEILLVVPRAGAEQGLDLVSTKY